jgi:hypothetical protein
VVVNEWQANPQDYEGFVRYGVDVIVEAEKFKQDGGELRNTVLLSLSNALGLPIIVLSSAVNHPVINTMPKQMKTPVPLYVPYNQYGVGHYECYNNPAVATSFFRNISRDLQVYLWQERQNHPTHTVNHNR